jgi:hypothetical protein
MSSKKCQPIEISFGGTDANVISFDPLERQAFVLAGVPGHLLVVAWDIDKAGFGGWRIKAVGVEKDEIITKEFETGKRSAAFYGDVSVVGASHNDLFTSFGYEDQDVKDEDGNVVNKVKEIRIRPVQGG